MSSTSKSLSLSLSSSTNTKTHENDTSQNLSTSQEIREDAAFLQQQASVSVTSSSLMDSVHASHVIQLQTDELVQESMVVVPTVHSTVVGSSGKSPPSWIASAQAYCDYLQHTVETIPILSLLQEYQNELQMISSHNNNNKKHKTKTKNQVASSNPFPILSDQSSLQTVTALLDAKCPTLTCHSNSNSSSSGGGFVGHSMTTATPLLQTSANAQVVPTLTIRIALPRTLFQDKDYTKHRYFDKRNCLVYLMGRYLSERSYDCHKHQTKQPYHHHYDNVIHAKRVVWHYECHDVRKPVLMILPPTQDDYQRTVPGSLKSPSQNKKKHKQPEPPSLMSWKFPKKIKYRIMITFGMEQYDWIPPLRLVPNRYNLQRSDRSSHPIPNGVGSPFYNHVLLEDCQDYFVQQTLKGIPKEDDDEMDEQELFGMKLQQAHVALQIWCLQRGLLRGHDTLQSHQLTMLLLYLFRTKQCNGRMSIPQILSTFWQLVANTNWLGEQRNKDDRGVGDNDTEKDKNLIRKAPSQGYRSNHRQATRKRDVLVIPSYYGQSQRATIEQHSSLAQLYAKQTKESPLTPHDPPTLLELYERCEGMGPVLLDPTMTFNFLGRLSPSFVRSLQREVQRSLQCLHATIDSDSGTKLVMGGHQSFQTLFMSSARFWTRYDAYIRVPLKQIVFDRSPLWGKQKHGERMLHDLGKYECVARGLVEVLDRALGDRVREIRLLTTGNGEVGLEKLSRGTRVKPDADRRPYLDDSDEIPRKEFDRNAGQGPELSAPDGAEWIEIGLTLNPDSCFRVVDRGPPADDANETERFLELWGRQKAELRRFKDGAIVYAVVWEAVPEKGENVSNAPFVRYQNSDKTGGIVERIIRHIVNLHFLEDAEEENGVDLRFGLRDMASIIDGVLTSDKESVESVVFDPARAFHMVNKAFNSLSDFLRKQSLPNLGSYDGISAPTSPLGIPLAIDAVDPLSPSLRGSVLFPPTPHPWIGSSAMAGEKKIPGVVSTDPIEIQVRFGASSKWPTDIKAIGAAKAAMLVQIVEGIESMRKAGAPSEARFFYSHNVVTPDYADIGYQGYVFRIRIRADPELRLLRNLHRPSEEAIRLRHMLTHQHVVAAMHHSLINAVFTSHPSASSVVRLASRWVSCHMLSGYIPVEAVELLVVSVYTDRSSPLEPPSTVTAGFLRFLKLLARHDWVHEPMVVDPQGSLGVDDRFEIRRQFDKLRGPNHNNGPPMYIVSPCDAADSILEEQDENESATVRRGPNTTQRAWKPSYTSQVPELVVLNRAIKLADRTWQFLQKQLCLSGVTHSAPVNDLSWATAFHETTSAFVSYSALLRIDPDFVLDHTTSSSAEDGGDLVGVHRRRQDDKLESCFTSAMRTRWNGPKALQRHVYRNLEHGKNGDSDSKMVLLEWNPVRAMVEELRSRFGNLALVFYNDLCPDVVALLWRRPLLDSRKAFSAVHSEYVRPVTYNGWQNDTLVTLHIRDVLREMQAVTIDMVVATKVLDEGPKPSLVPTKTGDRSVDRATKKRKKNDESSSNESESSSDSSDDEN